MGECLYVWEHSAGCENNKAAEWAGRGDDGTPTGLPVAQSAMNVSVCLRIIASLSLGRGSLCMMCSMKSLGMTEAMFHLSFPSTTSSQSCKDNNQRKKKGVGLTFYFPCALRTTAASGGQAWRQLLAQRLRCRVLPKKCNVNATVSRDAGLRVFGHAFCMWYYGAPLSIRRIALKGTQREPSLLMGVLPWPRWPWSRISVTLFPGNGSARRAKLLHSIPLHCILLSACLSHSLHPLYSYRWHVTGFALLKGLASQRTHSFLPVTSLGTAAAKV